MVLVLHGRAPRLGGDTVRYRTKLGALGAMLVMAACDPGSPSAGPLSASPGSHPSGPAAGNAGSGGTGSSGNPDSGGTGSSANPGGGTGSSGNPGGGAGPGDAGSPAE